MAIMSIDARDINYSVQLNLKSGPGIVWVFHSHNEASLSLGNRLILELLKLSKLSGNPQI